MRAVIKLKFVVVSCQDGFMCNGFGNVDLVANNSCYI